MSTKAQHLDLMPTWAESVRQALDDCYEFKKPQPRAKSPVFGLLFAIWIFFTRFTWSLQFLKFLFRAYRYRTKVKYDGDVSPWLQEIYLLCTAFCATALLALLTENLDPQDSIRGWLFLLAIARSYETLSAVTYYLVMRPIVDSRSPHSGARHFLVAIVSSLDVCLWLAIANIHFGQITASSVVTGIGRSIVAIITRTPSVTMNGIELWFSFYTAGTFIILSVVIIAQALDAIADFRSTKA